tara:strand:+ start:4595 stop:6259 length:1665 start_codon:yes stop_codon:yes gene_type:complete
MPISSNRRQRVIEFATPKVADLVVVERVDASKNINAASTADDNAYGTAHPDTTKFPNFKLALIKNGDNDQGQFQDWYYVKDRENQDDYNWEFSAAGGANPRYDTVVRTYVILRSSYDATSPLIGHNTANNTEALLNAGQLKDSNTFMPSGDTSLTPFDTDSSGAVAVLSGPDSGGSTISGSVKYNKDYILFEKKQVRSGDETLDSLYVIEQRVFIKRVPMHSVDVDPDFPYNGSVATSAGIGQQQGGLHSKETLFHANEPLQATVAFLADTDLGQSTAANASTNVSADTDTGFRTTDVSYNYGSLEEPTSSKLKRNYWGIDDFGIERTGKQLSDNWYVVLEREVIKLPYDSDPSSNVIADHLVSDYYTYQNFYWPPVFHFLQKNIWERRDGGSELVISPHFYHEAYNGPTRMQIQTYWRKDEWEAPETSVAPESTNYPHLTYIKPMVPLPMSFITPMFNVRVKACLHPKVTLTYTTGSDHPIWDFASYDATYEATNYDPSTTLDANNNPSWPSSLIISDTQKPFRGGYLRELITAYRPNGSRTAEDNNSNADGA